MEEEGKSKYMEMKTSTFLQNNFVAWRPARSHKTNAIIFLSFGIILLAIGIYLSLSGVGLKEIEIPYDGSLNAEVLVIPVDFPEKLEQPVMVYYQIEDFHQNYRRFSYSKNADQLNGVYKNDRTNVKSCHPILTEKERTNGINESLAIANPCGLLPKYYFNDTFHLKHPNEGNIEISTENIVFDYEKGKYTPSEGSWTNVASEQFITWMKIGPISPLKKLYGKIFKDLKGSYVITIQNNYRFTVNSFKGKRSIVFQTLGGFGGSQRFLSSMYFIAAAIFCSFAVIFRFCLNPEEEIEKPTEVKTESKQ